MLCHKRDVLIIDQLAVLLVSVHQRLFADPVDDPHGSRRDTEDLIDRPGSKERLLTAGIVKMREDIAFCFCPVQPRQHTVDIDPLADSGIAL